MEKVFNPFNLSDSMNVAMRENQTIFTIKDSVEPSYLYEATQFILEMHEEMSKSKQTLYMSIAESAGNSDIIHESFSDFVAKIKTIIDKFLHFIKILFAKFITKLNSIVKSDKYLEKNKKKFDKFTSDNNFDVSAFTFNINDIELQSGIFEDFENDVQNLRNSIQDMADKNSVLKAAEDAYSILNNKLDNYFDEFRGRVIGATRPIYSDDYQKELFATFRSGDSSESIITIDHSYITSALNSIDNHKKTVTNLERDKKNLDTAYGKIKNSVERFSKMKYDDSTKNYQATLNYGDESNKPVYKDISTETKNKIDMFIAKKAEQVEKCADIHVLAFAAKLDAVKAKYTQDKTILYKALSKIQTFKEDASTDDYNASVITLIDGEGDEFNAHIVKDPELTLEEFEFDDSDNYDDELLDMVIDGEDISGDEYTSLYEMCTCQESKDCLMKAISGNGKISDIHEIVTIESNILVALNDGETNPILEGLIERIEAKVDEFDIRIVRIYLAKIRTIKRIDKVISKRERNIKKYNSSKKDNKKDLKNEKIFLKLAIARKNQIQTSLKESYVVNYTSENIFNSYLLEKAIMDDQTTNILKECLIFADKNKTPKSVIESLNMINEGKLSQTFKDLIEKLKQFLNNIWIKFSEKAMKLFATDKAYLDKYKDTIIKTKAQTGLKYEMPDHIAGIAAIQSCPIDQLQYNDTSKAELAKGLIYNLNKTVPNFNLKEDADYNTALKNMFIGGNVESGTKEFAADSLNWTDIFNYCYNYKNMISEIEKGKNIILQSHKEAEKIITEMENEENKNPTTESAYSYIHGKVINEEDANKVTINASSATPTSTTSTSSNGNPKNNAANNTNTVTPTDKPEDADAAKTQHDAQKDLAKKAISGEIQQAKDNCQVYFNMVNGILAAKMTAIETIRKNYMAIIYDHVNRATNKDGGTATAAKPASDYSDGKNDKQPLSKDEIARLNAIRSKVAKGNSTAEENQEFASLAAREKIK